MLVIEVAFLALLIFLPAMVVKLPGLVRQSRQFALAHQRRCDSAARTLVHYISRHGAIYSAAPERIRLRQFPRPAEVAPKHQRLAGRGERGEVGVECRVEGAGLQGGKPLAVLEDLLAQP